MSLSFAEAIESRSESRTQPAHTMRKITMRRADAKMVMITHQAIRRKLPREPLAGFEKRFLKRTLRAFGFEDPCPVVASVYHVVKSISSLDTQFSRHGKPMKNNRKQVKLTIDF